MITRSTRMGTSLWLILLLVNSIVSTATARVIIEHRGSANPTQNGWRLDAGAGAKDIASAKPVPADAIDHLPAWQIKKTGTAGSSFFCYHADKKLTAAAAQQAAEQGWRVTVRLRVLESSGKDAQNVEFGTPSRRYVVSFDRAEDGDPTVHLMGGYPRKIELQGLGPGYHTFQLTSAPGSDNAFLMVDGEPVGEPYAGIQAGRYGSRFIFGNNASSAAGTANYQFVRLEIDPSLDRWPEWQPKHLPIRAKLLSVRRIWDRAPHNAFTDLVRWKGHFYCAFREGQGHAGDIGKIRLITSQDGQSWSSIAEFSMDGYDLRDADLSITPDDRLMVLGGAQKDVNGERKTGSFVSYSPDGEQWTSPEFAVDLGRWLWRVTWHAGKAYGVTYPTNEGRPFSSLLVSDDGTKYERLVPRLLGIGQPTEATLRFGDDDICYCLHRRDGKENSAYLGQAKPPYTDWKWNDLGAYVGGPNLIRTPEGHWLGAGRMYADGVRTTLTFLDVSEGTNRPLLDLPSGGDTSYPGLVWHDGSLWISYYSSHEEGTNIYLANVDIRPSNRRFAHPFQAVTNVCAWPNLTQLPDGTIVATIFNKPSHGAVPGDAECWASQDGGWTWQFRGTPARHRGGTNRMNVAAGLAGNGDFLVLCSGWSNPGEKKNHVLRPWVCRSRDGGRSWKVSDAFPQDSEGIDYIPFGDIVHASDGTLRASCYISGSRRATMLASFDDGLTWKHASLISERHNETAILELGNGNWLAAARTDDPYPNEATDLFTSPDGGKTWNLAQRVADGAQHPAHLVRLADERILMTYGDRRQDHLGVEARFSHDAGRTWGHPIRLVNAPRATWGEIGYPSSVQRSDGRIVTAYYVRTEAEGYSMNVVVWGPDEESSHQRP